MLVNQLKAFGTTIEKNYMDFKSPMQELVVWRTLQGLDTLAVLPTGAGKRGVSRAYVKVMVHALVRKSRSPNTIFRRPYFRWNGAVVS